MAVPHGLDEIIATFGDIRKYVGLDGHLDPRWQADFLTRMRLPFPLQLSWDRSQTISEMTCHQRMTEIYESVFGAIVERGLQARITSFGGCFAFRPQRTGSKLSTHCWGIALDLNTQSNPQGSAGNMSPGVIEIFRAAGFEWGGDWSGRTCDPMHFQYCTGY